MERRQLAENYISITDGELSLAAFERQVPVLKARFGKLLPTDRKASILDLGCGTGGVLHFLRCEGYTAAHGVDLSSKQIETARRLGISNVSQGDAIDYLKQSAGDLDCILAIDVVEHFKKSEVLGLLEAIFARLRSGGTLIVQTVNAASPMFGSIRYADFTHELAFTQESLRQILEWVGFKDFEFYECTPFVHGLASTARWVLWKLARSLINVYFAAEAGYLSNNILSRDLVAIARKS